MKFRVKERKRRHRNRRSRCLHMRISCFGPSNFAQINTPHDHVRTRLFSWSWNRSLRHKTLTILTQETSALCAWGARSCQKHIRQLWRHKVNMPSPETHHRRRRQNAAQPKLSKAHANKAARPCQRAVEKHFQKPTQSCTCCTCSPFEFPCSKVPFDVRFIVYTYAIRYLCHLPVKQLSSAQTSTRLLTSAALAPFFSVSMASRMLRRLSKCQTLAEKLARLSLMLRARSH